MTDTTNKKPSSGKTKTTKPATAKSTKVVAKKTSARSPRKVTISHAEMQQMIATNAYFRAESRGFSHHHHQHHLQDWLDAEVEISKRFKIKD